MKIKSLAPWCSLYSSKAKYNVTVVPSKIKALLLASYYLVCQVALIFVVEEFLNLSLALMVSSCLLALVITLFTYSKCLAMQKRYYLALDAAGTITLAGNLVTNSQEQLPKQIFDIDPSSKIHWLGCDISLRICSDKTQASTSNKHMLYLFKDSVSQQDYSRLCRIIYHQQQSKNYA